MGTDDDPLLCAGCGY